MDVHLTEQDQINAIRDWWNKYGKLLIVVSIIAFSGNILWRKYQSHKEYKSQYASTLYNKMLLSYSQNNVKDFHTQADYITANFPKVPYASLANFSLAKNDVKEGKLDQAIGRLDQVIRQNHSMQLVQVARIRKARILLAQKKPDEALSELDNVADKDFMPLINEVRGDIFYSKGENTKARTEYFAALKSVPDSGKNRGLLQMKYDQLAGTENGIV